MDKVIFLIADDDESDVLFLQQALTESCPEIRVETVSDGQHAIDYLSGNGRYKDRTKYPFPSHLLLDLKMPRRTGLEVLEWIRSHPEIGRLPVSVLSASQLTDDREKAVSLGAEYHVKPIDYPALQGLARHFCDIACRPRE